MSTPGPPQHNPYAPPTVEVGRGFADSGSGELASRGARLGAASIDGVIGFVVWVPAIFSFLNTLVGMGIAGGPGASSGELLRLFMAGRGFTVSLIGSLIVLAITARLVWLYSQTIGKRMMGIKVVRKDGSRASFARILWLRNVVNMIPGFIPFVGYVYWLLDSLMIYSATRQCLHDRIADTIVVRA
jgi:uncharacterized RDD family membrane protein YckC